MNVAASPAGPRTLLVIRHGQSVWNALGRWQGQADPPLSEEGEEQAGRAARRLVSQAAGLSRVFASDLQRARSTAEIIAGHLGIDRVETHSGLREVDVGAWSGLTREEIERRWPGLLAARAQGRLQTPPGGEPLEQLSGRVQAAIGDISAAAVDGCALVVTHRGPISTLERAAGLEPARAGNLAGHWFEWVEGKALRHLGPADLLDTVDPTPADDSL